MAERRMFAKTIVDSDLFIDMPVTARLLYYDLSMRADDDGFVNSPKKIMRMVGASEDDLKVLIAKKFIIPFDSGLVVITHWRIHNYIRKDTYNKTINTKEMALLDIDEKRVYHIRGRAVDEPSTQVRLGKVSIDKVSIDKSNNIVENRADSDHVREVINHLNEYTHKSFRDVPKTRKLIQARLNEGFTVEDFYIVIEKMYNEWCGSEWEKYIRPDTLFGTKFDSYLNRPIYQPERLKTEDGHQKLERLSREGFFAEDGDGALPFK